MDISLNQVGREQAEKTAEKPEKRKLHRSLFQRPRKNLRYHKDYTQKTRCTPWKIPKIPRKRLGKYEGKPKDDWREIVRNHEGEIYYLSPEESESLKEVGERFVGKLYDLQKGHSEGDKILLGGRGTRFLSAATKSLWGGIVSKCARVLFGAIWDSVLAVKMLKMFKRTGSACWPGSDLKEFNGLIGL